MTYKDNTPTYNVNRKVTNFGDFCKTCEEPKLKKIDRQTKPNSADQQQHIGNFSQKFNPVTRKIDYMSPEEVDDRIEAIEEVEESVINESQIDYTVLNKIKKIEAYKTLKEEFKNSINKFTKELNKVADEVGYDEGDTDHDMAYTAAIQEAIDELIGW